MGSKPSPIYEDLDVHTEWVHEAADDTLIAYLPGFKKEQIKVQVTTAGKLRISGQRPIGDNKFARFWTEIPIPSNCDQNKIRANFKGGMLHIKHPKLIVPAEEEEEAKQSAQVDQKPADASLPQKQPAEQAPPMEKETGHEKKADEDVSTNNKASATNESYEKGMEKEEKGSSDQQGKATSNGKHEKGDDSAENENIESKKVDYGVNKYFQLGMNYKQIVEGLVRELRNPRKMVNSALAVLLVVVLAVYVRNAIRSFSLSP
ncbi:hypothetical protein COLO4_25323 [Corchorus olitorius]|uniref:SHSP domain-containing protein n=1 Tax=Corchorus olitorius TaxID=93759 RepID=A0A1R3I3I4_9ROSI|nr:hypothetical protein COLO4_25323 [Corchorus olitorius]